MQMTRKKSSKFSADASCPISAGDTGSSKAAFAVKKARGDARVQRGEQSTNIFVKEKQNMCGIVGYVGDNSAAPILLDGLKKLEYRGYDSAGVAVCRNGKITTVKTKGRIADLEKQLETVGKPEGCVGIGHTRWATHGAPTDINAHPHSGSSGRVTLVHNGIIENYLELKTELEAGGRSFISQTDTEVLAQLFDSLYDGDPLKTMLEVIGRLRGSYAVAVLMSDRPDEILAAKKDSPLIVGVGSGENFLASDIPALLKYTRDCAVMQDGEIAIVGKTSVEFFDADGKRIDKKLMHITWDADSAEKGGYKHFMKKEIAEQPKAVRDTLAGRIVDGKVELPEFTMGDEQIKNINTIHIVACGSAWHVGMTAKYIIERSACILCECDLASEFRYRHPVVRCNDLCIVISQSGETADTLAALREAKSRGAHTVSIVNVVESTIARESDDVIYTMAGPEIAVATTKAFSAQLAAVYLLALRLSRAVGSLSPEQEREHCEALERLPQQIEETLAREAEFKPLAGRFAKAQSIFFIGRGLDYSISLEGSLKLKEISYIKSEAYAAGELKHGTISLIEPGTPVFAVATQPELFEKTLGNIREVKSRGAYVAALVGENSGDCSEFADFTVRVPETLPEYMPSLNVIPLQLIAYFTAVERGCDVDKPRNLAKSVTVE